MAAGDLEASATLRDIGHFRWKIENNAFGELTQHWHLTHCAHPHPAAVEALLWIKIIAFTLFHAFAILHGKLLRLGQGHSARSAQAAFAARCFAGRRFDFSADRKQTQPDR